MGQTVSLCCKQVGDIAKKNSQLPGDGKARVRLMHVTSHTNKNPPWTPQSAVLIIYDSELSPNQDPSPSAAQDNSVCHAEHCAHQESLFASVAWLSWDLGGRSTFWILWELSKTQFLSNSACSWEWQTLCHTPRVGTEQAAPFGRDWQGSHLVLITSGLTKSWRLLLKALCQCLLHTDRRLRDGTPKEGCKK